MYEVLTFHLGNVSTVRFFFPPVVHRWTFPCCRPIWSPAPRALWKRAMNSGKVGEPLGGRDFLYRWSWFIYVDFDFAQKQLVGPLVFQSQMVLCSKDLFYTRTCMRSLNHHQFHAHRRSWPCYARLDWGDFLLLLTSLVSSSSYKIVVLGDQHKGSSCSRDLFQPQHPWRLLGWLLVIVDHRPTVPQSHVVFGGSYPTPAVDYRFPTLGMTPWR